MTTTSDICDSMMTIRNSVDVWTDEDKKNMKRKLRSTSSSTSIGGGDDGRCRWRDCHCEYSSDGREQRGGGMQIGGNVTGSTSCSNSKAPYRSVNDADCNSADYQQSTQPGTLACMHGTVAHNSACSARALGPWRGVGIWPAPYVYMHTRPCWLKVAYLDLLSPRLRLWMFV